MSARKASGKTAPASPLSFSAVLSFFAFSLLAGIFLYRGTLSAGFHFDGITSIRDNLFLRPPYSLFKTCEGDNITRCLTHLTFALNFRAGGIAPAGYHWVNIAIHIASSWLIFGMLSLLFKTPRLKESLSPSKVFLTAAAASLIFLCHPLQTAAVAYIWQRFALLATFFYLLTFNFYLLARLGKGRVFYGLAFASMLCAMFSKEISATLPMMILVSEILFFGFPGHAWRKASFFLIPAGAALLLIPLLTLFSGKLGFYLRPHTYYGQDTPFGLDYLLTQFNVIRTYLRLLILPVSQNFDYDYPVSQTFFNASTLCSFLLVLAILAAAFSFRKRHPLALFAVLWFFVTLSVESSIIPIRDVIFEHRVYLPLTGFALLGAYALTQLFPGPRKFFVSSALILMVLAALTLNRNKVWKNEITLWEDVIKKSPDKFRGYARLCLAWKDEGDFSKAIPYCLKSAELNPQNPVTYNNLGAMYAQQGEFRKAKEFLLHAVKLVNSSREQFGTLGNAYSNLGNISLIEGDAREALRYYESAAAQSPLNPGIHFNRGAAALKAGDFELAKSEHAVLLDLHANDLAGRLENGIKNAESGGA